MNLYWPVYKNLEKELLLLADSIHIDDNQLNVYSVKIAEFIIRTAVEIEAISKELFCNNGGYGKMSEIFFDTDCIELLDVIWSITKKEIIIASPYLYLKNKILTPLNNCNKQSNGKWKKAYQAIKHNRIKSLNQGTIYNFIHALGALYILNIYYKWDKPLFNKGLCDTLNFDSDIFAITSAQILSKTNNPNGKEKYIAIIKYTDKDYERIRKIILQEYPNFLKMLFMSPKYEEYINKNPNFIYDMEEHFIPQVIRTVGVDFLKKMIEKYPNTLQCQAELISGNKLVVVLNKNQQIYSHIPEETLTTDTSSSSTNPEE